MIKRIIKKFGIKRKELYMLSPVETKRIRYFFNGVHYMDYSGKPTIVEKLWVFCNFVARGFNVEKVTSHPLKTEGMYEMYSTGLMVNGRRYKVHFIKSKNPTITLDISLLRYRMDDRNAMMEKLKSLRPLVKSCEVHPDRPYRVQLQFKDIKNMFLILTLYQSLLSEFEGYLVVDIETGEELSNAIHDRIANS